MATMQTLRNKAGLLIMILIGLALLGFVFTDMFQSAGQRSPGDQVILEINGEKVLATEYFELEKQFQNDYQSRTGQSVDDNTKNMIANQVWDKLLRDNIYKAEFQELGLGIEVEEHGNIIGITKEELMDIVVGNNVDPQIQQIFRNQETNQYDKNLAMNFLQNMDKDPERKQIWLQIEKQLMESRVATKYNYLIMQGINVTTQQAKMMVKDKSKKVDFKFVSLLYGSIPDSSVTVTESDLKNYYNQHKKDYHQQDMRSIEYVQFPILPSNDDYKSAQEWINKITESFKNCEDDIIFASSNTDIAVDDKYYKKDALVKPLDTLFDGNIGDIFGPYFENEYYKVTKLSKIAELPDSVKARHILLSGENAQGKIDSIKNVLKSGGDFADLALRFSQDKGSAQKGGDLGWFAEGAMVKSFNDSCFFGTKGNLYVAYSQYGIHLIEVMDQSPKSKKVQLITIATKVKPSTATRNTIFAEASKFAGDNNTYALFEQAVKVSGKYDKRVVNDITRDLRSIAGVTNARQIVKWAFNSEKDDVSGVFETEENFVVSCLVNIKSEGVPTFDDIRSDIEKKVINVKKAEKLTAQINAAKSSTIDELAIEVGSIVREVPAVDFTSMSIQGIGNEPAILANISLLENGQMSQAIKGEYGVYVLSITKVDNTETTDYFTEKLNLARNTSSKVSYSVFPTLKKISEITDNRLEYE